MTGTSAEIPVLETAEQSPRPKAGGRKLKILLLLFAVMAVEGAGIYLLLPSPASGGAADEKPAAPDESAKADVGHTVEVPIEPIVNVTNSLAAPGSIIHVTFKLVAVVPRDQQLAFEDAVNVEHNARVRQAIVKVARSTNMDDLSDPELSTLKRMIREEMNKVLRKSYVHECVISDFKTMEQ
jgi:flagellar basal body-associated protein FliL